MSNFDAFGPPSPQPLPTPSPTASPAVAMAPATGPSVRNAVLLLAIVEGVTLLVALTLASADCLTTYCSAMFFWYEPPTAVFVPVLIAIVGILRVNIVAEAGVVRWPQLRNLLVAQLGATVLSLFLLFVAKGVLV